MTIRNRRSTALLAAVMMLAGSMAGAGTIRAEETIETEVQAAGAETAQAAGEQAAGEQTAEETGCFTVACENLTGEFSPFFARRSADRKAAALTQENLLPLDRSGGVILNGIEGETAVFDGTEYTYYGPADCSVTENADGTISYEIRLRNDLSFSDGEPVTIDDVIFDLYVRCDPTYDGPSGLGSMPIQGLAEYRSGMRALMSLLIAAGRDNTDFTYWTQEQQTAFFDAYDQAVTAFTQEIVDYCKASGSNGPDDSVAQCAASWGYQLKDDATLTDFWNTMVSAYSGDLAALSAAESAGSSFQSLMTDYSTWLQGVKTGVSADSISGIERVDDYTLRITATKMDATMLVHLADAIAPLHVYGDPALYDYEGNSFGFTKGDLSGVRSAGTAPVGMGPYRYASYENGVVSYEANDTYYQGTPATAQLKLVEEDAAQAADAAAGEGTEESTQSSLAQLVADGAIDAAVIDFDEAASEEIRSINAEGGAGGELDGSVLRTVLYDHPGFGYIGINADNVRVGEDSASDASKNLRRGFATLFAAYRAEAVEAYYGESAQVIEYPISAASWAAPRPEEEDYEKAFCVSVDGTALYTDEQSAEERHEAAAQAALGFFEAAGATVENGTVTAMPEGAKTTYVVQIPAEGVGDHPAYAILTGVQEALAQMGITLEIRDIKNVSDLWGGLRSGDVDMWCAAWSAEADPDLYAVYYAASAKNGENAGISNYMYGIRDLVLDEMILMAREGDNRIYRKALYKACLDTIMEWACVVPTYQRKDAVLFNADRVNMDTVPEQMTAFYDWDAQIQELALQ